MTSFSTPLRLLILLALVPLVAGWHLLAHRAARAAGTLCVESTTQHVAGRTVTTPTVCVPDLTSGSPL